MAYAEISRLQWGFHTTVAPRMISWMLVSPGEDFRRSKFAKPIGSWLLGGSQDDGQVKQVKSSSS